MKNLARLRQFARDVVADILDDRRFHQAIRELVLRVLVEQEIARDQRAVRSFLTACQARGVRVKLDATGRLVKNNKPLGADLEAVLTMYREEIVKFLQHKQDMERLTEQRMAELRPTGTGSAIAGRVNGKG